VTATLKFGLFFFSAGRTGAAALYELVQHAARFGDREGFEFVSLPERHFDAFGSPFPAPAVLAASLAAQTDRIQLRAGSVVLPLHHVVRVAEDWAVVDQLSKGRVALSLGSGWNVNDFLLAPDRYHDRRDLTFSGARLLQEIWKSGRFSGRNGEGKEVDLPVLPRPVQGRLPLWLTASKSEDTFRTAGRLGYNVLTHLENQDSAGLATMVAAYREERHNAGHDPADGTVTVMQHAFVAASNEDARRVAEPALRRYLEGAMRLETRAVRGGGLMSGRREMTSEIVDDRALQEEIVDEGVRRYLTSASLIGSLDECFQRTEVLRSVGADEIACLVDFIDDPNDVIGGLEGLARLRARYDEQTRDRARDQALRALMDDHD
jgi:natural product biosynthesis luciferase-like monooxygenase protein